jgi:hypothetical protein
MPTRTPPVEDVAARWRTVAGDDNPAGPLFSSPYAEADLVQPAVLARTCSWCTASTTAHCC